MRSLLLLALAACAHPVVASAPKAVRRQPSAVSQPPKPPPLWPVPVRVLTWTSGGPVQLGVLPDAPPPTMPPATPWYVEPIVAPGKLDHALFGALVAAVKKEHVPGVSFAGHAIAAWTGELVDLPDVTGLVLSSTDVDAAALDRIDLHLQRIYLARTAIDDAAMVKVVAKQAGLEVVDVEDCVAVGDASVRAIATLAPLRAVNLAGTAVTDDGGAALAKATTLAVLDLGRTKVGAKTAAAIANLPLQELFLDATLVPPPALAKLAPLAKTISRIDVTQLQGKPTDAQLAWLAGAPNLYEASLNGAQLHDALVAKIVAIPPLRELRIAEAPITLAGAKAVAARQELEVIDLGDTVTDDTVAPALYTHPNLRVLRLDHDKIGDAPLAAAALPASLVQLWLSKTAVTDAGLATVLDTHLDLDGLGLGDTAIGEPTIARIGKLAKLTTLVLTHVRPAYEHPFVVLGNLVELRNLYLQDARVGDEVMAAIKGLVKLRALHLAGTDVSEESLGVLRGFKELEELAIGDTRMRDGIADLSAWRRLRTLSIMGLAFDDANVATLAKTARALVELDLSATGVTDPTPLVPLARLKVLGLVNDRLVPAGETAVKQLAARGVRVVR